MEVSTVDPSAVRRVLAVAAPAVEIRDVRFFGEGWDNTLFLVNHDLVVRIARRDVDSARLLSEAQTLVAIGPHLSLPIPQPEFVHRPSADFPLAAMGYRVIPGVPLTDEIVAAVNAEALSGDLATFLRRLHAMPEHVTAGLAMPSYTPADWLRRHDDLLRDASRYLRRDLDPATWSRFSAWWDEYRASTVARAFEPCLIHGDLSAEHILVESNPWRVSGVIDFGDAMVADPALDLAGIPDLLARATIGKMWRDSDADAIWERRRAYRLMAPLHAVLAGRERGDESLFEEGIHELRSRIST